MNERLNDKNPAMTFRVVHDIAEEQSLTHHGILGQKWGYLNGPPYPLSNSQRTAKQRKLNPVSEAIKNMEERKEKKAAAKEAADKELAYKKNYKNMSDDEMRSLINRAQLEKQYKDLVLPKEKESYAKKLAIDSLKTVGSKTVNEIVIPITINKIKEMVITHMEATGKYSAAQINALRKSMNMGETAGRTVKEIMNATEENMTAAQIKDAKEAMNNYNQFIEAKEKASGVKTSSKKFDFTKVDKKYIEGLSEEDQMALLNQAKNMENILGSLYRIDKQQFGNGNNNNGNGNNNNGNGNNQNGNGNNKKGNEQTEKKEDTPDEG